MTLSSEVDCCETLTLRRAADRQVNQGRDDDEDV